ncbi:MAG: hypothetical protein K2O42_08230, partial [Oscillospiraceae bacterium]|nr:hypothetical protein [Oscillospiraceae bacterium]
DDSIEKYCIHKKIIIFIALYYNILVCVEVNMKYYAKTYDVKKKEIFCLTITIFAITLQSQTNLPITNF